VTTDQDIKQMMDYLADGTPQDRRTRSGIREFINAQNAPQLVGYAGWLIRFALILVPLIDQIRDLSRIPEPDWSKAPDVATAHAFTPTGLGIWLIPGDYLDEPTEQGWGNLPIVDMSFPRTSGLRLPMGIDWRTTLRMRPEADDA